MASISSLVGTAANNLLTDPALLDPVSKLRISNPQSMIDTDFEYGVQTTKWEYLLTVNNTPAYYVKPGSKNPINIVSFYTIQGSILAVVTAPLSGVVQGMPLEIVGLVDYSLDGLYAVRKVNTPNTFQVRLRSPARNTGEQITPYTVVNVGGLMTASYISLLNTWSVSNGTNLWVQTTVDHGLVQNNSVTLLNTVNFVPKIVDGQNVFYSNAWYANTAIGNAGYAEFQSILTPPVAMGNAYLLSQVMPYNWMSANVMMVSNAGLNNLSLTSQVITTPYGHGMDDVDNYALFVICPPYSNLQGGTANLVTNAGGVYWANVVTPTTLVLRNAARYGGTNVMVSANTSLTQYLSNNVTFPFLLFKNVCEISNVFSNGLITFYSNHNCNVFDSVVFANLGGLAYTASLPIVRVANNLTFNSNLLAGTTTTIVSTSTTQVTFSSSLFTQTPIGPGQYFIPATSTGGLTAGSTYYILPGGAGPTWPVGTVPNGTPLGLSAGSVASTLVFGPFVQTPYYTVYPVTSNAVFISNSQGLPLTFPSVGTSNPMYSVAGTNNTFMIQLQRNFPEQNSLWWPGHNLVSNQTVFFQGNTSYLSGTLTGPRDNVAYFVDVVNANRFRLKQNLVSTGNTIDLIDATNAAVSTTFLKFSSYSTNTAQAVYLSNHGIINNDVLVYYSNQASAGITGLANYNAYYAKYISPNYFRLSPDSREVNIIGMTRPTGSNTCNLSYVLNPSDVIFAPGDTIQINLNSGEYPDLQGIFNVYNVTSTTISVNLNSNATVTDNISTSLANCIAYKVSPFYNNNFGSVQLQTFVDVNTIDGYYSANIVTNNVLSVNVAVPINDKYLMFDSSNILTFNVQYNTVTYPYHSLADGAVLTYQNFGNPNLIGFVPGQSYFAVIRDANTFSVSDTPANALTQRYLKPFAINRTGHHAFVSNNMIGNTPIVGQYQSNHYTGFQSYISNTGSGITTRLTTNFTVGKRINVINSYPNPPFTIQTCLSNLVSTAYNVTNVYSDYSATVTPNIAANTMTGNTILIPMSILVEPTGYVQHRPFDGGVLLTTGTDPNQSVVRQTRTYFRYQAGKGVQMSSGTNFNPPQDCDFAYQIDQQTIQVQASKSHGFSLPLASNIILSGTTNFVNGTFPLVNIIDTYNFQLKTSNNGAGTFSGQTISVTDGPTLSNIAAGAYPIGSNVYLLSNFSANATIIANTLTTLTFAAGSTLNGTSGAGLNFFVAPVLASSNASGYPRYCVQTPSNVTVRIGMFDSQNGVFFECISGNMYCVRRNSIQQTGGVASLTYGSSVVIGTGTNFTRQLSNGNVLAIRGMTYVVSNILNDTQMTIVPAFRGISGNNIVISKVQEIRVPQSQWSLDRCDGTGPSGYLLDITKIQMVYIDFAWYGAGKIRFGFKNQFGKVFYVNEITNANIQNLAYLRSGNLPARYELRNDGYVSFQPYLFHWGTSVIIDGMFSDDKNYYFTGDSDILTFTNGINSNVNANTMAGSTLVSNIAVANAYAIRTNYAINANVLAVANKTQPIVSSKIVSAFSTVDWSGAPVINLNLNRPAVLTQTNVTLTIPGGLPIYQLTPIPVLSIRLSPSADSSVTGALGARDLVTRMQLVMKACDATVTHETQVQIFLNCDFSYVAWTPLYSPSLAQYYKHQVGDTIRYGIQLISFRAAGGNLGTASSNVARSVNTTTLALDTLAILSNSIYGGDGVFPNGPDTITVCMTPIDTSTISATAPYQCATRLSWIETQA